MRGLVAAASYKTPPNQIFYSESKGSAVIPNTNLVHALGVLYSARFPEKVAAYCGAGQLGNWPASEATSYQFTLAEAERRRNQRALRELLDIGPRRAP